MTQVYRGVRRRRRPNSPTLSLFPEDHCEGVLPDESVIRLRLWQLQLRRPRQWGGCYLAL